MADGIAERELALFFDCARSFRTMRFRPLDPAFRAEVLSEIRDELLRIIAYTASDLLRARADALLADINAYGVLPQESVA